MSRAKDIFDMTTRSFPGSPVEQARFLLRTVRPLGNISSTPAALPEVLKAALEGRLARPATLNSALRKRIRKLGLSENTHFGGSLDKPLSKAGRKPALYFVITTRARQHFRPVHNFPRTSINPRGRTTTWIARSMPPTRWHTCS